MTSNPWSRGAALAVAWAAVLVALAFSEEGLGIGIFWLAAADCVLLGLAAGRWWTLGVPVAFVAALALATIVFGDGCPDCDGEDPKGYLVVFAVAGILMADSLIAVGVALRRLLARLAD